MERIEPSHSPMTGSVSRFMETNVHNKHHLSWTASLYHPPELKRHTSYSKTDDLRILTLEILLDVDSLSLTFNRARE